MFSIPPALIHRLGQLSRRGLARRYERAALDPAGTQHQTLLRIIRAQQDTAYGRDHRFAEVTDVASFRRLVPLTRYADLHPYIERQMSGERGAIVADPPLAYARTSGTAGQPKDVPLTDRYRAEFQQSVLISTWHIYRRYPEAFRGQILYFVGSADFGRAGDGAPICTISGFNYGRMPTAIRSLYAWPDALFSVSDLPTRSLLALLFAAQAQVSIMAGIFPSTIVQLLRYLEENRERVADALECGRIPEDAILSEELRARLGAGLRPSPSRAEALRAHPSGAPDLVRALLPALRLVYCWTSATAGAFVPELQRRIGDGVQICDAVYSASEGWCSIPMGGEIPGGALATTAHFFEFIPEAELGEEDCRVLLAHELEVEQRYAIVITASSGMTRYVLGDIVEVTGTYRATPMIQFVRKAGACCNLVGENLDETHITAAVIDALSEHDLQATWFCAAPEMGGELPRYALYLELEGDPGVPVDLGSAVDRALSRYSVNYPMRLGTELAGFEIRLLAKHSYRAWAQAQVDQGAAEAQLKTTHLVDQLDKLPLEMRQGWKSV